MSFAVCVVAAVGAQIDPSSVKSACIAGYARSHAPVCTDSGVLLEFCLKLLDSDLRT